jgi:hypothetical protein
VIHWLGSTMTDNLVSLCRFHHRRHHDGAFKIRAVGGEAIRFELSDGMILQPIVAMPSRAREANPAIPTEAAVAVGGGAPFDREYAISVIADACADLRRRDADGGGG